jgi:hypothetical protein
VLAEGLESLCGVDIVWVDAQTLGLRIPGARAEALRIHNADTWQGLTLRVDVHEDQVVRKEDSPDGQRRLIVVRTCESDDWNLYLRRQGEPTFNTAMQTGWDDPELAGGFSAEQPVLKLAWDGPRSATITVAGKNYNVTIRDHVGDVAVHWKFTPHYKPPSPQGATLKALSKK